MCRFDKYSILKKRHLTNASCKRILLCPVWTNGLHHPPSHVDKGGVGQGELWHEKPFKRDKYVMSQPPGAWLTNSPDVSIRTFMGLTISDRFPEFSDFIQTRQ